jgi:hypothetical protein
MRHPACAVLDFSLSNLDPGVHNVFVCLSPSTKSRAQDQTSFSCHVHNVYHLLIEVKVRLVCRLDEKEIAFVKVEQKIPGYRP